MNGHTIQYTSNTLFCFIFERVAVPYHVIDDHRADPCAKTKGKGCRDVVHIKNGRQYQRGDKKRTVDA